MRKVRECAIGRILRYETVPQGREPNVAGLGIDSQPLIAMSRISRGAEIG